MAFGVAGWRGWREDDKAPSVAFVIGRQDDDQTQALRKQRIVDGLHGSSHAVICPSPAR